MVDMTNAGAAVYALDEPLVRNCPELTVDRVIADYTVSQATCEHERTADARQIPFYGNDVPVLTWRDVVRRRLETSKRRFGSPSQSHANWFAIY